MNISKVKNCFGCGVCSSVCPRKIIKIECNKKGFYEPVITDENKCSKCGICKDVCSFCHDSISLEKKDIKAWAAWSNDEAVRRKCSSGGIGFEIAKLLIDRGYKVVACRYDTVQQRAEHYIASNAEELIASIGSKYIQSYTADAFAAIDRKQKYLVTGTPCQIDSFRRMVRRTKSEDNFILMDFYCHCVPSMHAWKNYMKMIEPKTGRVTYASWRNKFEFGWHDSWLMGIDGEKTSEPVNRHDSYNMLIREKKTFIQSRMSKGDWFYKMFLGHYCNGPQCERDCKYKYDKSAADIRIGDLWGNTYQKDEKGVNALVTFTKRGEDLVKSLKGVTLIEHDLKTVAEGQMKTNAQANPLSPFVMLLYSNNIYPNEKMWRIIFSLFEKPFRAIAKIKRMIKHV